MLWAEAIGHCMNPECQVELIKNEISIGEMAHIKAHADGGDVSFDNLLLLCGNCHTQTDGNRTEATVDKLKEWKRNRNGAIVEQFAKRYASFGKLKEAVTPILERNGQIFDSYGPLNDDPYNSERHDLWLKFEGELISNNRRLEIILTKNKNLLPKENQAIVGGFVTHAREFTKTRGAAQIQRVRLFPQQLLSIFGISQALVGFPPNLSALQNFVSNLLREGRFVSLRLNEDPRLTYMDEGAKVILMLEDRPRVQQIFWNGNFFTPRSTDVRIESLVFFAQWLYKNQIHYEFADMKDLTTMSLNKKHKVKLCYKYVLSVSDVQKMTLTKGDMVVNLHNWNGAPVSEDAHKYAKQIGVRLFGQNDFFKFAHRNIK
jgi:hypothetical protein